MIMEHQKWAEISLKLKKFFSGFSFNFAITHTMAWKSSRLGFHKKQSRYKETVTNFE